jgi:hypothetical protein
MLVQPIRIPTVLIGTMNGSVHGRNAPAFHALTEIAGVIMPSP